MPPKVLFYYPDFGAIGGIETYIVTLVTKLSVEHAIIPVVVCSANTPFYYRLQAADVMVHGITTWHGFATPILRLFDFLSMAQLWHILNAEKPDMVHVHIGHWENMVFRWLGYPLLYTFHGYATLYSMENARPGLHRGLKNVNRILFKCFAQHVSKMVLVSHAELNRLRNEGYLPSDFTGTVVHNGLPIAEIDLASASTNTETTQKALGLPPGAPCVLFMNRLDSNKNVFQFIAMAEALGHNDPDLHFVIAGTGPLESEVAQTIQQSALARQFHFVARVPAVPALLAVADLVVHVPLREGFGLGILEAMATGTPVLCTAVGGIPELIGIELGAQCLVPSQDINALITQARYLLDLTPSDRQIFCAQLQERAKQFDIKAFLDAMKQNYTDISGLPTTGGPLVSIIMPVYQGEDCVLGAIQSVLNQTYPYFELIIVDDGSTDGTFLLLEQLKDKRIRVISQVNQGVSKARNHGMQYAIGEYIAFLDADDRWFPQKLADEVQILTSKSNSVGLVYSGYYAVDAQERLVNISPVYQYEGLCLDAVLEVEGMLLPSTTMVHRDVITAVGGFPIESYHEDRVFFIRVARQFPIYSSGQRLVVYRQTLDGRCRRVLRDYDAALVAERSITEVVQSDLSHEQIHRLEGVQMRSLLYRFLMYNFLASAKKMRQQTQPVLSQDKKGHLARLSFATGVNWLYYARITVQFLMKTLFLPWWRLKSAPVYKSKASV